MSASTISDESMSAPPPERTEKSLPPVVTDIPGPPLATTDATIPSTPTVSSATPKSARPTLPALITPKSASFPSELPNGCSQPARLGGVIKQEDDLKTPMTPPAAYTDFLKALSPAVSTPSTARSPMFDRICSGKDTPITQPSSAISCHCTSQSHKDGPKASASAPMIPPSPYMRPPSSARLPHSARTPTSLRRLRIPPSPGWSPASESPISSAVRSPYSPADWGLEAKTRYYLSPTTGTHKPISVRQVVTRTVTYTRTPLDPAPKGKKRRLD